MNDDEAVTTALLRSADDGAAGRGDDDVADGGPPPSTVGACPRPAAPPNGGAVPSTVGACPRPAAPPNGGAVPSTSLKFRRHRRTRPRGTTIAMKRVSLAELRVGAALYPAEPADLDRPRTRADCGAEARPCPWVACKHHLYLDINPETGSIKINFPDLEPWELKHTCALDVADTGGKTLDEIGEITNLTRERIRQVEVRGLVKLRARRELR